MMIGQILKRGNWRTVDNPFERARKAEEAAARLEAESARTAEEKRAGVEAKARAEIIRMGFVEYLPREGSSAEECEAARKAAWRKQFQEYPYSNPKVLKAQLELCESLHVRWLEREARKLEEYVAEVADIEKRRRELAEFEAGKGTQCDPSAWPTF